MKTVVIIGMGTMGTAIQVRLQGTYRVKGVGRTQGEMATAAEADVVILAVKPQSFAGVIILNILT